MFREAQRLICAVLSVSMMASCVAIGESDGMVEEELVEVLLEDTEQIEDTEAVPAEVYIEEGLYIEPESELQNGGSDNVAEPIPELPGEAETVPELPVQDEPVKQLAERDGEHYTITYNLQGGVNAEENPGVYTAGEALTLSDPTRKGYTFGGWYTDARLLKPFGGIVPATTGNIVLYARWTVNSYTIRFEGNGADNVEPYTQAFTYGKAALLAVNRYKRVGYTFTGWNTDPEGQGTSCADRGSMKNATAEKDGVVVFYAQWKLNTYTIRYVLNGGTNSDENPASYTVLDGVEYAEPTRPGFVFGGWYTDARFTKKADDIEAGSIGNRIVYARWTANRYTVVYDANGGSGTQMKDQVFTCGQSACLAAVTYSMPGYSFAGWNTEPDGSGGNAKDRMNVKSIVQEDGAVVTLYAQWKPISYRITYSLAGGTNAPENPSVYTALDAISFADPVRSGFRFDGWYWDKLLTKQATDIPEGSSGNRTLYAKWTAYSYTVIYDANGGSGSMKEQRFECGRSARLTASAFTKAGYVFDGWNTEADGSGTTLSDRRDMKDVAWEDGSVVTLYAQWKLRSYTITYMLNGGSNSGENPASYTQEDAIDFADPVRKGFNFRGWYTEAACKNRIYGIQEGDTGNRVVYAKWELKGCRFEFYENGTAETEPYSQLYAYGTASVLPANRYKRTGYTFTGWNTEADGSGTSYADRQAYKYTGEEDDLVVPLYAQWELEHYTITYVLSGGTNDAANPTEYSVEDTLSFADPTRTGYDFDGWYADAALKNRLEESYTGLTGNKTVYAKWKAHRYTFIFDGNGATNAEPYRQELEYGTAMALRACVFTMKAKNFGGWNTEPDGTGTAFADKQSVLNYTEEDGAEITLYAQWKDNMKTVSYRGVDFEVVNRGADVLSFEELTYNKCCQIVGDTVYHGKCLSFAWYHTSCIYLGITDLSLQQGLRWQRNGCTYATEMYRTERPLLKRLYELLNNGKPQILMVQNTAHNGRHFVTVVGYKSSVTDGDTIEATDLLILDSHDGRLESMDPAIFPDNTRLLHMQNGAYRLEAFK